MSNIFVFVTLMLVSRQNDHGWREVGAVPATGLDGKAHEEIDGRAVRNCTMHNIFSLGMASFVHRGRLLL